MKYGIPYNNLAADGSPILSKHFRIGWIIAVMFLVQIAFSQQLPQTDLHARLLRGIDLTLQQDYQGAREAFQQVIDRFPLHPAGYIYFAGSLQAEAADYESHLALAKFDSLLAKGQMLSEALTNSSDQKSWGFFYTGLALAFRSYIASEQKNWYSTLMDGMSSARMFERCLELNPNAIDAMSGLGTYYYWRSRKTEFLSWLPILPDRRKEAIDLLQRASRSAVYERAIAANSLMWILIEEKRYAESKSLIESILLRYPSNRSFLRALMNVTERMGDEVANENAIRRTLESTLAAPVRNIYEEILCRLKLANYASRRGEIKTARDQCFSVLRYRTMIGKTKRDIAPKIASAEIMLKNTGGY